MPSLSGRLRVEYWWRVKVIFKRAELEKSRGELLRLEGLKWCDYGSVITRSALNCAQLSIRHSDRSISQLI